MSSHMRPIPPTAETVRRNNLDLTFMTVTSAAQVLVTHGGRRIPGPWMPLVGQYQLQGWYSDKLGLFFPIGSVDHVGYEADADE